LKKYSLILSDLASDTKITVWELCKNNESLIQSFMYGIEDDPVLLDKFAGAISIIEQSSNLKRLPKTKFRQIEGHHLKCKVYEAKSGIIRIYLFHEEHTGRIIVSGGKKGSQKKDIKSVIKLIKSFYKGNEK
jgi:hypothetical protein